MAQAVLAPQQHPRWPATHWQPLRAPFWDLRVDSVDGACYNQTPWPLRLWACMNHKWPLHVQGWSTGVCASWSTVRRLGA